MKNRKIKIGILMIIILGIVITGLCTESGEAAMPGDKAMSVSGFCCDLNPDCYSFWRDYYGDRFTSWGYDTWYSFAPTKEQFGEHLNDNDCKYVFIVAHSGGNSFMLQNGIAVYPSDIDTWLQNRNKKTFTFIYSCDGMGIIGLGSLEYAFRKGSSVGAVVVGTKYRDDKFFDSWHTTFLNEVETGATFKEAFNQATIEYPIYQGGVVFTGDECLTIHGTCGDVNNDGEVTMSDVRKVFNRYMDPSYPLENEWAADVNCDGAITMSDARKVFNRYMDPSYELNCCCG